LPPEINQSQERKLEIKKQHQKIFAKCSESSKESTEGYKRHETDRKQKVKWKA